MSMCFKNMVLLIAIIIMRLMMMMKLNMRQIFSFPLKN